MTCALAGHGWHDWGGGSEPGGGPSYASAQVSWNGGANQSVAPNCWTNPKEHIASSTLTSYTVTAYEHAVTFNVVTHWVW